MRALLFKAVGEPLALETIPDPTPSAGEMIVRVSHCGVCGTDLHATSGHGRTPASGSQLGHEYAGEIVALGKDVEGFCVGENISALPVVGCGNCDACRTGIDVLCRRRSGYGGGLAEFARVSARGAAKLPQTVSLADGALVEPLAVGRRAVRLAALDPDSRVLVIGPGPIGLAVLFWLRQAGVRNIVVMASSGRRRRLAEALGAEAFLIEGDEATEEIHRVLGSAPDVVFEAAGVPGVMGRAIDLVRPGGMIVALGFCLLPDPIIPGAALLKDITLRWSLVYTREDYAACVDALDRDGAQARAMVTDTVGMVDAPAAFERLREGTGAEGKLLIAPWA